MIRAGAGECVRQPPSADLAFRLSELCDRALLAVYDHAARVTEREAGDPQA